MTLTLDSFPPATATRRGRGLNLLVYGPPGVGKTTFAGSAPSPLLIDCEGGAYALADRPDVRVAAVRTWADLQQVVAFAADTSGHPFQSVILDSLTEAFRLALQDAMRADGKAPGSAPEGPHYGAATEKLLAVLWTLRSVSLASGLHTLFTALEVLKAEATEGDTAASAAKGRLIRRPDLTPSTLKGTLAALDSVVRLSVGANGARKLHLHTTNSLVTLKFRAPGDIIVPDTLPDPTVPALLALLHKEPDPCLLSPSANPLSAKALPLSPPAPTPAPSIGPRKELRKLAVTR